jgi:hypothetical protein
LLFLEKLKMRLLRYYVLYAVVCVLLGPLSSYAQAPGEREISLGTTQRQDTLLELLGLPRPEFGGLRLTAFLVGSFSYNSHIQMVPEFAGGAPALALCVLAVGWRGL